MKFIKLTRLEREGDEFHEWEVSVRADSIVLIEVLPDQPQNHGCFIYVSGTKASFWVEESVQEVEFMIGGDDGPKLELLTLKRMRRNITSSTQKMQEPGASERVARLDEEIKRLEESF